MANQYNAMQCNILAYLCFAYDGSVETHTILLRERRGDPSLEPTERAVCRKLGLTDALQ
jgi:hypothetical protein